jgi:hypothetical protein
MLPVCPKCKIDMKPASYGMMPIDPAEKGFYYMGCLIDSPLVAFGCSKCDFQILEDGTTRLGNA